MRLLIIGLKVFALKWIVFQCFARKEIVFICTQSLQLAATQVLENTLSCTFIVANWFHPTISNESEAHNIYFILSSHSSRNLSSSSVNKSQTGHSHLYFGRAGATFSYFRLNCFLKELTWFVFQPDPNQTVCNQIQFLCYQLFSQQIWVHFRWK